MRQSQAEIDALLDEHQAREREDAERRAELGDRESVRPDAERVEITFGALLAGDYMTAEKGPTARWVEVTEKTIDGATATITFKTPQPLGVGLADRWVIHRPVEEPVTVDATARPVEVVEGVDADEPVCVECNEPYDDGGCGLVECPHGLFVEDPDDDGAPF